MKADHDVLRSRWAELMEEERTSEATLFVRALEWLQLSHYVLNGNHKRLVSIPKIFDGNTELVSVDRRPERQALLREFTRRLHNYLASVKSFVDHTRRFRHQYVKSASLNQEILEYIRRLTVDPDIRFLQKLRNPVLHSHLPRIALVTTFPDGRLKRQLMINADELLDYADWSAIEREYVGEIKEGYYEDNQSVDIVAAVNRYQDKVTLFYDWLYHVIEDANKELMEEYRTRLNELANIEAQLRRP